VETKGYYVVARKEFAVKNDSGRWLFVREPQIKRRLKGQGVRLKPEKGEFLAEVDQILETIMNHYDVTYAGPLAGYQEGFYEEGGERFLVTISPRLIKPEDKPWPMIQALLDGLLDDQQIWFQAWLKVAVEALMANARRPGQVLVMAGPKDCGKSLLQNIITECLGGRSAKPYAFMRGGTEFNADLFTAEHLMLEDEVPSTDMRSRRNFGAMIKSFTVNESQRCHPKGSQAWMAKPFWRLSVSLNDEPENLQVLPPLDDSLEDKLIILRAYKTEMPMPTESIEQREAFWNAMLSELPGFVHHLLNWTIPEDMVSQRFGVKEFHNEYVLEAINQLSPEAKMLALIDASDIQLPYVGSAANLEHLLKRDEHADSEANKLFHYHTACGQYLGRCAHKFPDRVQCRTLGGHVREWTITKGDG